MSKEIATMQLALLKRDLLTCQSVFRVLRMPAARSSQLRHEINNGISCTRTSSIQTLLTTSSKSLAKEQLSELQQAVRGRLSDRQERYLEHQTGSYNMFAAAG